MYFREHTSNMYNATTYYFARYVRVPSWSAQAGGPSVCTCVVRSLAVLRLAFDSAIRLLTAPTRRPSLSIAAVCSDLSRTCPLWQRKRFCIR